MPIQRIHRIKRKRERGSTMETYPYQSRIQNLSHSLLSLAHCFQSSLSLSHPKSNEKRYTRSVLCNYISFWFRGLLFIRWAIWATCEIRIHSQYRRELISIMITILYFLQSYCIMHNIVNKLHIAHNVWRIGVNWQFNEELIIW